MSVTLAPLPRPVVCSPSTTKTISTQHCNVRIRMIRFVLCTVKTFVRFIVLGLIWVVKIFAYLFFSPLPKVEPELKDVSEEEMFYLTPEEIRKKKLEYYDEYIVEKRQFNLIRGYEILFLIFPIVLWIYEGSYLAAFVGIVVYMLYRRYMKPTIKD
ncbi:MAG: hypothetical protein KatS3mg087_0069 [Patescibacteria group bacterium]|nr:MAG: hypothetical protein KatS3mg087_0069 [Patescibacteria group bacterium]